MEWKELEKGIEKQDKGMEGEEWDDGQGERGNRETGRREVDKDG